jgi:hypothetical protein
MLILAFNSPPSWYFWFLAKVALLKVFQRLKNCQHTSLHGPTLTGASFAPTSVAENPTIAIFQRTIQENNYSNKTCMYVHDLYCTKPHLSKCKGVVSKNKILIFYRPSCSYFSFLAKMALLKVVHPLKIYQNTKFHDRTLTGASLASTSKVWMSTISEWLQLRH